MPVEITMPQLSDTMSEGTLVKWLKKEGDKIKAGEIIAEVETDKATMEMEAFEAGTLAVIDAKEGAKIPVGGRIAVLAKSNETVDQIKKQFAGGAAKTEAPKSEPAKTEPAKSEASHSVATFGSEADNRHLGGSAHEVETAAPTATASREQTAAPADNGETRTRISPLARKIAEERGINISDLRGSGPNGRIVQKDVEQAASATKSAPAAPQRVATGEKEVVSLNKMRQTIALRLQQSKQQIPHFYESIDVDAEAINSLREKLNKQYESQKIRLSVSDFINKAIAVALQQHPTVNAHFNAAKNEYTRFGDVHLGIAVALPDGLIVPVLKNIGQMSWKEIRQRSVDLAERARAGKLKGDEMTGATFTVSTLGQYGIKQFNAIINPPEVGILAVGAAELRAVVRNGQVVARSTMTLTISVDHRVVDGALAAEFLRTLKNLIEEPAMMFA